MTVHIGLVTSKPYNFNIWAWYHGVHQRCILHVYYDCVSDQVGYKGTEAILKSLAQHGCVYHITTYNRVIAHSTFDANQSRQQECMDHCIKFINYRYPSQNNFLIHIDDDEILYAFKASILNIFRSLPPGIYSIQNWEARIDAVQNNDNIFDTCVFETDPAHFHVYANGKSAATVTPTLKLAGPHNFVDEQYAYTNQPVTLESLKVMHYNCTSFEKWLQKYLMSNKKSTHSNSVFPFDRASHSLVGDYLLCVQNCVELRSVLYAYYLSKFEFKPQQRYIRIPEWRELLLTAPGPPSQF